ncbi:unnamed protein product [Spirodela intermedia]|uniref:Uncharacterized protein n=1 Tax=Spirodela intermedia TaxID=51605 RepID=A0A7I8J8L6_SPIIN|nr:unnamed protein product [Spirodela intermedia]CAA6665763.1 unnamed protein product [Spirodela intermedia]
MTICNTDPLWCIRWLP